MKNIKLTTEQLVDIYFLKRDKDYSVVKISRELGTNLSATEYAARILRRYIREGMVLGMNSGSSYRQAIAIIKQRESGKSTTPEREESVQPKEILTETTPIAISISPSDALDETYAQLKKAIKAFITSEIQKNTPVEKTISQKIIEELHSINNLPPISKMYDDEEGISGYWLEDIVTVYGNDFTDWYRDNNKTGGIIEGKYYVKEKDFKEYEGR